MAFTRSNLGTANNAGPASSLARASLTAAIGDIIVVMVASANSGTSGAAITTTCADSVGNTYTQRSQVNRTAGVTDDGITLTIFTAKLTSTLTSGTITVSFSPSSAQACTMTVKRYRPAAGETALYIEAGAGASGNGTTPSITSLPVTNGDTIVGGVAAESGSAMTGDSDTTDGTWSTKYDQTEGSGAAGANVLTQDKDVTATGVQTFNVTSTTADYAINYIIIRSASANKLLAAIASSYAVGGQVVPLTRKPHRLITDAGSCAVSGTAATLTKGVRDPPFITALSSAYVATGVSVVLMKAVTVAPVDLASYVVTGSAATLATEAGAGDPILSAGANSYAVSGQSAGLRSGRKVTAAASSYAATGATATLRRSRPIAAGAGSYAATGAAATLRRAKKIAAAAGSNAATGSVAATKLGRKVTATDVGFHYHENVGGQSQFRRGRKAIAGAGGYLATGDAASVTVEAADPIVIIAGPGVYAVSGQAESLLRNYSLSAG